ncbi:hypothetical protein DFA_10613 [Cavenderia fasciculata]|uniref:Uncharacterized protein n=1 Tax=Cavenderia fasciculata TaxID=261658 RepID=F4QAQ1_CACFS|nr:uncharacterized protein DFA_10613 [Cavenderia fasciculata]EGG15770.1 hypothetical protein DFA_10613 [Cavenderia fasciculata]|eukprot:XP_004354517.1 hypothetical protein DFA_10613 [Cavenderia fasciculata]
MISFILSIIFLLLLTITTTTTIVRAEIYPGYPVIPSLHDDHGNDLGPILKDIERDYLDISPPLSEELVLDQEFNFNEDNQNNIQTEQEKNNTLNKNNTSTNHNATIINGTSSINLNHTNSSITNSTTTSNHSNQTNHNSSTTVTNSTKNTTPTNPPVEDREGQRTKKAFTAVMQRMEEANEETGVKKYLKVIDCLFIMGNEALNSIMFKWFGSKY